MRIDGKAAQSGTLVIAPGQKAELILPWGAFELVFNPSVSPMNVSLSTGPGRIVFDGTDNPIGVGTSLNIPFVGGQTAVLALAVYAIGSGFSVTRIVHYTIS